MDSLYSILKIVSMIATGVFGALGLLTRYKNEHGQITRWGKVALAGIIVSLGLSLGLYTLETSRAKAAAAKAEGEAKAQASKLETILVNAQTTAEQQRKSLAETNSLKLDLSKTLEKSDYIAKELEGSLAVQIKEGKKAVERNNQMMAEVERTIHPLFPLEIKVIYRAPLTDRTTRPFRQTLEGKLKTAKLQKPDEDIDLLSLNPKYASTYPSQNTEPLGYGLVTADLGAWIRFYTKGKTLNHNFKEDDADFCYCPLKTSKLVSAEDVDRTDELVKERFKNRQILFDPETGLRFDDGVDKIDLMGANAGGDFISSDDLYGATIQIEARPFIEVYRQYGRVANDLILLEGCFIKLPGNRAIWIKGDRFSATKDKDQLLYRFTFPGSRQDFNKLLTDY